MQSFTIFDMVIVSITVLLGLKGLFRGFIKEVFGLIGIIGGIFIASRMAGDIGNILAPILALENTATIKLIGFILGLIGFWIIVYVVGMILSKVFAVSGLGVLDRIFGFLFGATKVFLIFSVIIYAIYQIESFKNLMNEKVSNSITFPFLVETGGFIVKLNPADFVKKVEKTVTSEDALEGTDGKSFSKEISDTVEEIKKTTVESGSAVVDTVKKTVNENVDKIADSIEETSTNTPEESSEPTPTEQETTKTAE